MKPTMYDAVTWISAWLIPVLIAGVLVHAVFKRVAVYETFVEGAKGGFATAVKIIPHLVGMMVAVQIFRESGAMSFLISLMDPVLTLFHVPGDIVPLAMLRSITGTGALAVTTDIMARHGPDSFLGRLASTMQGSTDTTLYILAVYFGAVGIKKSRYALKVGLIADFAGIVAAIYIVRLVFA